MKTSLSVFHRYRRTRSGIALISVLAMVVLLTALVVAFMLRAGSERQSSGFYKAETGSRALADTAINLVQAQINDATSQGPTVAWASQPGAIRTFSNSSTSASDLLNIYRLYSNPTMRTSNVSSLANDVPAVGVNWLNQSAVWVDLNAPVNNDPNQAPINTHFPILDPRDPSNLSHDLSDGSGGAIMDGFSIDQTNVPTNFYANNIDTYLNKNPAPMPVQWLYVLQDGSVLPPDSGSTGTVVQFTKAPTGHLPSAVNPIVGRIAFWTDDETCKVNINTAGGDGKMASLNGKADPSDIANRAFWSIPTFASIDDTGASGQSGNSGTGLGFAYSQPASGEYQRYPGHPAMVGLNHIFNALGATISPSLFYCSTPTTNGITPRYVYGGSTEGTVKSYSGYGPTTAISAVVPSSFRLYPSVGELLFNPDATSSTLRSATPLNTSSSDSVTGTTRQRMETARFFLTAHSRSSELNLFGLPRICMWPMPFTTTNRTPVDNLLAFCSTIGTNVYYFTRKGSSAPYGSADSTADIGIGRNQTLLAYLDMLTRQNIPGFGGNFAAKDYGNTLTGQNDQIITEIFDYIRIINIGDATTSAATVYGLPKWQNSNWGCNQVVPSLVTAGNTNTSGGTSLAWNTQGYGSYPRLVEATMQFVAMGKGGTPASGPTPATNAIPVSPAAVSAGILNTAGDSGSTLTYAYVPITSGTTSTPTAAKPYTPPGDTATHTVIVGTTPTQVTDASPSKTASSFSVVVPVYNKITQASNTSNPQNSGMPPDGTTAVQAFLMLSFSNPAQSWFACGPYVWVSVTGMNTFTLNTHALGFPAANGMACVSDSNTWHGGGRFGYYGWYDSFYAKGLNGSFPNSNPVGGYPFFSLITPISSASPMVFNGGTITVKLYDAALGPSSSPPCDTTGAPTGCHLIQTYTIPFSGGTFPVPTLPPTTPNPVGTGGVTTLPSYAWVTPTVAYGSYTAANTTTGTPASATTTSTEMTGPIIGLAEPVGSIPPDSVTTSYDRWGQYGALVPTGGSDYIGTGDVLESMVLTKTWSDPRLLNIASVPATAWVTHPNWGNQFAHNLYVAMVTPAPGNGYYPSINGTAYSSTGGTHVGSLAGNFVDSSTYNPAGFYPYAPSVFGDNAQPTTVSGAPPDWDNGVSNLSDGPWINKCDEGSAPYNALPYYANPNGAASSLFSANREVSSPGMFGSLPTGVDITGSKPAGWQTLLFRPGPGAADYLNGSSSSARKHPGEGTPVTVSSTGYAPPYSAPPDHLWMDLFWMPVAEPYAISEPFSTEGKVNLNYQILPFTYITRATALRAAMATEKIPEVSLAQSTWYKGSGGYPTGLTQTGGSPSSNAAVNSRYPIDLDTTQTQFDAKFSLKGTNPDIFRSASQICEMFLVPLDGTNNSPGPASNVNSYTGSAGVQQFAQDWYAPVTSATSKAPFAMVGDNLREQPYTNLYGKLTTKSNTFTVYYRVQTLKSPPSLPNTWDDTKGAITGEYRGSTTLERYIDPTKLNAAGTATDYPDFATSSLPATNLEPYYQWRIVENRQFTP